MWTFLMGLGREAVPRNRCPLVMTLSSRCQAEFAPWGGRHPASVRHCVRSGHAAQADPK